MLKKNYLRLGLVLGGLLSSVIALADNPSQSHKRLANNNTNPYGICKNGDVDVFSCELNSGDKLSLCANDNPKKIELGLKHHSGSVQNILMSEPKQIIAITRSGGTSIIRENEKTGPVSLYILEMARMNMHIAHWCFPKGKLNSVKIIRQQLT